MVGQEESSSGCAREGLEEKLLDQNYKAFEEAAQGSHSVTVPGDI